ncbi:LuxR C-terminal-related transcriptional regulator [Nocardioides sp. LHG3406-4]|uniref:helix-turn-helix transcriptional regulator n=1 Tax=Nocardioides sp. LHG3406-4 TaxID=2804575 RepID=UPI003CEB0F13
MSSGNAGRRPLAATPPTIPRLPHVLVDRSCLLRRLDQLAALTLLVALPGTGRTVLAAAWAQRRREAGDVVAWIDATAELATPERFFGAVHDAVAATGLVTARNRHLSGAGAQTWRGLADALGAEPAARVIVVVDDYEHLTDPGMVSSLGALLRAAPRLHLVATVRVRRDFDVSSLRQGTAPVVIWCADLAVAAAELPAFAQAWGHTITRAQARTLHEMTGGWLTPTRLLLDHSPEAWRPEELDQRAAAGFLKEQVLAPLLDTNSTRLAQRLALPATFGSREIRVAAAELDPGAAPWSGSAGAADDAWHLVRALEHTGLARPVGARSGSAGDAPRWAFASLVRSVLSESLAAAEPGEVLAFHRAMADDLLGHEDDVDLERALLHSACAKEWDTVARIWGRHALRLMIAHTETTAAVFTAIPSSVVHRHPFLRAATTVAQAYLKPEDGLPGLLLHRQLDVEEAMTPDALAAAEPDELAAVTGAAMASRRAAGDLDAAVRLAQWLCKELDSRRSVGGAGPSGLTSAWFTLQRAFTLLLAGHDKRATELTQRAYETAGSPGAEYVAAGAAGQLAFIHARNGDTSAARVWLDRYEALDLTPYAFTELLEIWPRLARAWLRLDQLDPDAMREEVDSFGGRILASEMWCYAVELRVREALLVGEPMKADAELRRARVIQAAAIAAGGAAARIVDRCQADLYLAIGQPNQALRVLDEAATRAAGQVALIDGPGIATPWVRTQQARLRLVSGQPERALRLAGASMWSDLSHRDRCDLLLIKAAAAHLLADHDGADAAFRDAMTLLAGIGGQQHLRMVDPEILAALAGRACPAVAVPEGRRVFPHRTRLVDLSSRERSVLYALARNEGLQAIANAQVVSPHTIKKQIVSLYKTLGVHSREDAVLTGLELGFLPEPEPGSPRSRGRASEL